MFYMLRLSLAFLHIFDLLDFILFGGRFQGSIAAFPDVVNTDIVALLVLSPLF
jgi:hypothetical protein